MGEGVAGRYWRAGSDAKSAPVTDEPQKSTSSCVSNHFFFNIAPQQGSTKKKKSILSHWSLKIQYFELGYSATATEHEEFFLEQSSY